MDDAPATDVRALWQSQPAEPRRFSPGEIRALAEKVDRAVRARNRREYVAAVIVVAGAALTAWTSVAPLSKVGAALWGVAALVVAAHLARHGTPGSHDGAGSEGSLRAHRRELVRQRDLLASVWRWYIGPFVPGLALFFAGELASAWAHGAISIAITCVAAAAAAGGCVAVGLANARAARRLDDEIAALDADTGP
jgi:hypothetical protein